MKTIDINDISTDREEELEKGLISLNEYVCQELGKVLGYPWFKDDQENFPGSTEEHGVCVGDHVAESITDEAVLRIKSLQGAIELYKVGQERQKRIIESLKESRDRWQSIAEELQREFDNI